MSQHFYLSFSGGKDSTASAIIAHEKGLNVTIIYAHFYFDKARNITAVLPEHEDFIQNVIFPKFKEWGFEIIQVEPVIDYVTQYHKTITRGKNKGYEYGFPMPFKSSCWVNSRLKMKAINKCHKIIGENPEIIGIAYDEIERYERICTGNKQSILFDNKITEHEALEICKKYGLLSPIYDNMQRDGCWFCNQMNIASSMYIKEHYPELIEELKILEKNCNCKPDKNYFAKNYQTVEQFFNRKYKRKPKTP